MRSAPCLLAVTASALLATAAIAPAQTAETATFEFSTAHLPPGSKIDTKAVPRCDFTPEALEQAGGPSEGCPEGSQVGSGQAAILLGDTPLTIGLRAFNRSEGLWVEYALPDPLFGPATIDGRHIEIPLDAARELNARPTRFTLDFPKAGTKRKPWARTPGSCPKKRKWRASVD